MQFNHFQSKENLPKLEDILEQLKSGDTQLQSVALHAFNVLVDKIQEPLNPNDIDKLVDLLEDELSKPDFSLRTELLKTVVIIGEKIHPNHIKGLLPMMINELDDRNRFRSKIIIDMFANISRNADATIQAYISAVIQKSPRLITFPYLQPVLKEFFSVIIKEDIQNIYKDKIKEAISQFPPKMKGFTSSLQDK